MKLKTVSIVIPALNEEKGIGPVLKEIPIKALKAMGYNVEVLVIDNGSHDQTPHIARSHGAKVIVQPIRGYGNAYKAGFANANGDIIATGDADLTYPFSILPEAIEKLEKENVDFINTDRLSTLQKEVMEGSHVFGNYLLSFGTRTLFRWPFKDSQSGMWIFKRQIWDHLDVRSSGMPFSQELKIEAHVRGFKCAENIKLMTDKVDASVNRQGDREFIIARSLINGAQTVHFLGFGYNRNNLDRLGFGTSAIHHQGKFFGGTMKDLSAQNVVEISALYAINNTISRPGSGIIGVGSTVSNTMNVLEYLDVGPFL